ncbi:MAG: hypothetical protein LKG56_01750 [Lachnospiraceae bacterium]|jgi:serine protease inhibitor|nr:hypothetical protein [Lachnospiraceae bacterium]MCH4030856.1 hypothetical protein [Lachnospiraceae bacterium]MCH4070830.1 hypothetical protein [Lachnospiraceae bacterium]MCH4106995.1 hypothetical protein [Lachnospiraceae bacterium]MCI1302150.1 hypothetical protein [Lachnospiraceae bacterium]
MRRKLPLLLLLCLGLSGCGSAGSGISTVKAEVPDSIKGGASDFINSEEYVKWLQGRREAEMKVGNFQMQIYPFYREVMREILSGEDTNTVVSPVNLYLALGMLSEAADGATREQILNLTGCADIAQMRERAQYLFDAGYADTPVCKVMPGSSVWLNSSLYTSQECLQKLSSVYRADSFSGVMGSEEMNKALQNWTNEKTGNLLQDYVSGMKTEKDTAMEMVSTLYLKGQWSEPFSEQETKESIFHGSRGDETVPFLNGTETGTYYYGEQFSGIARSIADVGTMYFFLPEEGLSPQNLIDDDQVLSLLENPYESDGAVQARIRESIPKFSASSKTDLIAPLQKLGVTDAFDAGRADFSALLPASENPPVCLAKADHAAMVMIDEEGVTGAAYTEFGMTMAALPPENEISFVLDRPFLFVVTGDDNSILFAGTVYTVQAE